MQTRGVHVMGVDQYTSAHVFEDLADGGRGGGWHGSPVKAMGSFG